MNTTAWVSWDLDGTICQFDERVIELTGTAPHVLDNQGKLWSTLHDHQHFFAGLDPYPEMVALVQQLRKLGVQQRIITGRPRQDSMPFATKDKINWVNQHIGFSYDVIVCLSRDKQKYLKEGVLDILVDDRVSNIENWRRAGGVAIHHTSYPTTRSQLFALLGI